MYLTLNISAHLLITLIFHIEGFNDFSVLKLAKSKMEEGTPGKSWTILFFNQLQPFLSNHVAQESAEGERLFHRGN